MTESPRRNLYELAAVYADGVEVLHLADETVLIYASALLSSRQSWRLGPHLLHILEHHIAVTVEGLDPREELLVIAARDQDLRLRSHGGLEDG